jgi:hypothetical protein
MTASPVTVSNYAADHRPEPLWVAFRQATARQILLYLF